MPTIKHSNKPQPKAGASGSNLPLREPPAGLCILRLTALGDVTHTVPVVRANQQQ